MDARSDTGTYREIAESLGLNIPYVIDTHVHALLLT